ncbi:YfhO family protein [Polynucleobacter sp. UB-Tiil-W10]|uniref:YfhO family protein n=1 Tax=Polynucleobacter sp. UB-Tiil-W10 TaxID=1855648 RepID=UPI001C0D6349|nr:YfhO family protein [Polynucleobacter sp. UB-Tiil-W10]MBU3541642.1 hypothetical protein [Polynucleobacter sp. UB-Tiil-W10]
MNPKSLRSSITQLTWYALLALVIAIIWLMMWGQRDFIPHLASIPLPSWRDGDMPIALAWVKSGIDGSAPDLLFNFNQFLNAPYIANWNDFPGTDFTQTIAILFAHTFGLFLGINLYLLFLQILSGLSFYFVTQKLQYARYLGFAGGVIFAFAPAIYFRGIGHLTVATIWYIPLLLLSITWFNNRSKIDLSDKGGWILCAICTVFAGLLNIYYAALFGLFIAFYWIANIAKRDTSSQKFALLLWLLVAVEIFTHLSFFLFNWQEGINPQAMTRGLPTLLLTSLTLPDLIHSPGHRPFFLELFSGWNTNYYASIPALLASESQLAYIGITAACGLGILAVRSSYQIFEKKYTQITHWFWLSLGIFAFSITGGINYLLGSLHYVFLMIRSNNRFSIFLMAIGLLYLCELLSKLKDNNYKILIAALVVTFSIWDQVPISDSESAYLREDTIESPIAIQQFTENLEKTLEPGAMIFQLPIHAFPENAVIEKMGDYEELLPYLFSQQLRFSFGSIKGREDTAWQAALAQETLKNQIILLESYGFSALLVHKNAHENKAKSLIDEIRQLAYPIISENEVLIAFKLKPSAHPVSPAPEWQLNIRSQFKPSAETSTEIHSWSVAEKGQIEIRRPWYLRQDSRRASEAIKPLELSFSSLAPCSIWVQFNQGAERELKVSPSNHPVIQLNPMPDKINRLSYRSDCPIHQAKPTEKTTGGFELIQVKSFITNNKLH